ncbi:MAG: HIT family protein [Longimicrobiales bacterium]
MPSWHDPEQWQALRNGTACPVCMRGEPLDMVMRLDATWLTMKEAAPMRGYVCLVLQQHAVEFHDLDDAQAAAFMRDVRHVSRALAGLTGAVKLNYEVHGNVLPHLHMHILPRYIGDPYETRPIDLAWGDTTVYAPGEFVPLRQHLMEALR